MKLGEIFQPIFPQPIPAAFENVIITSLCSDSRRVKEGCVFVALEGPASDGAQYLATAIAQGAAVVVRNGASHSCEVAGQTLIVTVPDSREFLQVALKVFYQDVSQKIRTIGITGTNGKTTITYLLESMFAAVEKSCGVIGTVNYRFGGKVFPAKNTTPGMIDNHRYLQAMLQAGCVYCAMEVSSHALAQARIGGIDFKSAVFTNLTQDHLDYHRDQEDYFQAKAKLFTALSNSALALINQDDDFGRRLVSLSQGRVKTYGVKAKADIFAREIVLNFSGTKFILDTPAGSIGIETSLVGVHNVYNILAAAGVGQDEGLTLAQIKQGLEALRNVPGRLERVEAGQEFTVLVDYAHTEDALKNVLSSLRQVNAGQIILVFGCGGDRDKTKRPLMGRVASDLADLSIITNDNPRSEEPQDIVAQIVPGFSHPNYKIVLDRREAIQEALRLAKPKDIVLIAGKGHEDYQIFKDRTIPFDERAIVRECLVALIREQRAI